MSATNYLTKMRIAENLGSTGASPVISGASPEAAYDVRYSKRRLPHFERPWAKYAVAFSTHERNELSAAERDIVLGSMLYARQRSQYELYTACVMPDHAHLLFEPQPKDRDAAGAAVFWSLSEIMHGIKSSTAHRIAKLRRTTGVIWESESFDRLIRSEKDLHEKFNYIYQNAFEARLVSVDEVYPWLWTPEIGSAGAPNRAGGAPALPGAPRRSSEGTA